MKKIFSTDEVSQIDRFRLWHDMCQERLVPMSQECLDDRPFQALIEGSNVGGLTFTKFSIQNLRSSTNHQTIRDHKNKTDCLFLCLVTTGFPKSLHYGRASVGNPGDLVIHDTKEPLEVQFLDYCELIVGEIPRARLEGIVGSARNYAGLAMRSHFPVTTLARSFLRDLAYAADQLDSDAAERMATVAIDLVAASIAERLAIDSPESIRDTLIFQRAKIFIKASFCNPHIGPTEVASASGVSLRHLQMLFRKNGINISAWIWRQRLELAAQRLSDRTYSHLLLGQLAYECGFTDQAHFSRRFRQQFGLSPKDYRQLSLEIKNSR